MLKSNRVILCNLKVRVTVLFYEKSSIYPAVGLSSREISYVLYVHGLMCALMTRKSCAVGMRNAIVRN